MTNGNSAEASIGLSAALIGGAFGFIGIAIFASASYADKVAPSALTLGNWFTVAAVVALLVSVIFGGKGTMRAGAAGTNLFQGQAWSGLIGVVLLLGASAIFAFNPKAEEAASVSVPVFEARMHRVEMEQQALAADVRALKQQTASRPPSTRN